MKATLGLYIEGEYWRGGANIDLTELQKRHFEPLKTCNEPIMMAITGDVLKHSKQEQVIIKTRKDVAEILAKELAVFIIKEMSKNDTHNGYKSALNIGDMLACGNSASDI